MTAIRTDSRNAIQCAAACLLVIAVVWPVAEISFADDWSFAFTAKRLAETGNVFYNGWSSPSVISQSYWGAIWIRLFGFHFTVLRLSTAPLAAGSTAVTYLLARRAGLVVWSSLLVAVSLMLSPLFLPLATSFMTDVPGLFCILLAVYGLVRTADSPTRRGAIKWMTFGLIAAATGGSSRQIVWIVPLALLPMVAWQRRRDRLIVVAAALGWVVTFAAASLIQRWFDHQPFALPEPSIGSEVIMSSRKPVKVASQFFTIVLTLLMVTLPAGIAVLRRVWATARLKKIVWPILFLLAGILFVHPFFAASPWMGNMISPEGILAGGQISGPQPVVLPAAVWVGISLGVYLVFAALLAWVVSIVCDGRRGIRKSIDFFLSPPAERAAAPALVLVAISYLSLLLTRCALDFAYDRHVMPLIPFAAVLLLLLAQNRPDRISRRSPALSWVLVSLYGLFAIAGTQQSLALSRARVTAADRLSADHIPREKISAGFEFDCWTELLNTGYINESRVVNPRGAYRADLNKYPDVKPDYRVEFAPTAQTVRTRYGSVEYFSWLPPFRRSISIDRFRDDVPMLERVGTK